MVIFNSYVKLPEGISHHDSRQTLIIFPSLPPKSSKWQVMIVTTNDCRYIPHYPILSHLIPKYSRNYPNWTHA